MPAEKHQYSAELETRLAELVSTEEKFPAMSLRDMASLSTVTLAIPLIALAVGWFV